jgi:hypothetical protein
MVCRSCGSKCESPIEVCAGCGARLLEWEAADGQVQATPSGQALRGNRALFALIDGPDGAPLRVDHVYAGVGHLTVTVPGKGSFDVATWRFLLAAADGDEAVSVT